MDGVRVIAALNDILTRVAIQRVRARIAIQGVIAITAVGLLYNPTRVVSADLARSSMLET